MFHLKSFSNSNPSGVVPSEPSGSRRSSPKGSDKGQNHSSHNPKKKRSRRRRKPRGHSKVEPLNPSPSKKQHDAPMTKRDLYFSLACEVVLVAADANSATAVHTVAVARVTIVNWDTEVVLDTFVEVPGQVIDYMGTGITTSDIQGNPQAMDFATVRNTIERILCGKILIGYQLQEHLFSLGLTHPSTDVRDVLFYCGSSKEDTRSIEDLAEEVLKRTLPNGEERHRSIETCIAALDLYKANRKEWEMKLIERARESELERQQEQQIASPSSHEQIPYGAQQASQPQNMLYQPHQQQRQQEFPQQTAVPTNYLPAAASHPYGQGTYLAHSLHQQSMMVSAARNNVTPQNRSNSSWFSLGRKSRYPQQAPGMSIPGPAQATLSSQALEALSYPSNSFDYYEGSSAYSGSGYELSTDYGSSIHYEGSVVSEDVISVVSESVASSYQDDSENIPAAQELQQSRQQTSESSSWFRFSRKSRYAQQQREPMTVVQESNEPEEPTYPGTSEDAEQDGSDGPRPLNYEPQRFVEIGVLEDKKQSSSWFGFKRSKSPGVGKKEKIDDPSEEVDVADQQDEAGSCSDIATSTEEVAAKSERAANEKQSSWFKFGRRSSMRSKSPSLQVGANVQDEQPQDEVVTLHTEASEATDEDWWQEVMKQPGNSVKPEEIDMKSTPAQWSGGESSNSSELDGHGLEQSASKSSTWFRFLRSPKSASKQEEMEECLEHPSRTDSFASGGESWLEEAARPFDPSVLGPAWFEPSSHSEIEKPHLVTFSPESKEMDFDGLLAPRARLATESTIPSVATASEEEEDFSQEFVHGMEKNLSFLNI